MTMTVQAVINNWCHRNFERFGKSIKEWLEIKAFQAWRGTSRWVMYPAFSCFLISLIIWQLGIDGYFLAKPRTFVKKYSLYKLYRVLPKSIGVSLNSLEFR